MSTILAQRLVDAARSWRGTRFQHQGNIKGLGVDCCNFVSEVAREAGVVGLEIPKNYRPHEDGTIMLRLLNEHMELVDEMQPGDVLALCDEALREPDIPRHLAFVTELRPQTTIIIHASQSGVKEHRMNSAWLRRVHSIWRLRQ
jgi:Cell wall-associated hydrolases (invasion-associated proteins)